MSAAGGSPTAWFLRQVRSGGRGALVTVVAGASLGAKLAVAEDGRTQGGLGSEHRDRLAVEHALVLMARERSEGVDLDDCTLLIDVTSPPPRVVVVGAIDVSVELVRLGHALGWSVAVCDPRSRFARPDRFPRGTTVVPRWPRAAFAELGGLDAATSVVVLTHDPKIDDEAILAALESPARYIGAMGARTAQRQRRARLRERGVSDAQLGRLRAPIGLDLGGSTQEETALAILAEILAVRQGRRGGPLTDGQGPIHQGGD